MKRAPRPFVASVSMALLAFAQASATRPAAAALAQEAGATGPVGSGLPLQPTRQLAFTTREGTWMSVDVSPDGRTIVFDHLGDLYLLPIEGGRARRLLGGMGFDTQPRFSPDGRHIAFVSDRSGWSAVWTIAADGSGLRRISPEARQGVREYEDPIWTPDGTGVVALFISLTHGGTSITRFSFSGGEEPRSLVTSNRDRGFFVYTNPSFSRDGRYLYLASLHNAGADVLGGANDRAGRFGLVRFDTLTNEILQFDRREGGAFAPHVTQSGDALLYATRDYVRSETVLRRYDLVTGEDRLLTRPVQFDLQEGQYYDTIPSYDSTDGDRTLVLSHSGKLWRVDAGSGRQTEIPFEIDVALDLGPLARFDYPLDDSRVQVRGPIAPRLSPDGESIAFGSVGAIWIASTRDGEIRRLTRREHRAQKAAWSPDGEWIAYSTWDPIRGEAGLWRIRADGRGRPMHLLERRGPLAELLFTPDGRAVLARTPPWPDETRFGDRFALRAPAPRRETIISVALDTRRVRTVALLEGRWSAHSTTLAGSVYAHGGLQFSGADQRLYFRENNNLQSIRLDGGGRRVDSPAPGDDVPSELLLSPSGDRVLRIRSANDYSSGVTLEDATRGEDGRLAFAGRRPVRELTDMGWSADGRYFWGFEDMRFVRYDRAAFERDPENYRPDELALELRVPTARPSGSIVLRGARIITMRGNEVIERGDLVVTGNRIAAVGTTGAVAVPAGATVIDVQGRTILPGWVDIHAHNVNSMPEYFPAAHLAEIAYGVTAIRDPSPMEWPLPAWDDIAVGLDIGPRGFTTGLPFRHLEGASDEYLAAMIRRYAEGMRTETLKQYRSGGRAMRQRIVALALQHRLTPTNETLEGFWGNLSMVIDGYGGVEHSPGITPYYDDVVQLIARSGTVWTPTLAAAGPDSYPDDYIAYLGSRHDLNREGRYQRFIPRAFQNLPRYIHRVRSHDRYLTPRAAGDAARIVAAGGRVGLGSHGDVIGVGVHYELWTLAEGGMPLHDVLRVGTIFGAEAVGHGADFGSIEPGKLADLQVLARNPLDDIRNSISTEMVMANGFLYDAETLDQLWPQRRPLPRPWWLPADANSEHEGRRQPIPARPRRQ